MEEILNSIDDLRRDIQKKYGMPIDLRLQFEDIEQWVREKEGQNND